jgi:hypothetical protein
MRTHTALRVEAGLAGLLTAAAASGAPAMGPTPERQAPEVTLYFAVPVGMRRSGAPLAKLGIGLGQVQAAGNLGNPAGGDAIRRRELLTFDVSPRRAFAAPEMRVTVGGRMTYDLNREVFGWRKGRAAPEPTGITFNPPVRRSQTDVGRQWVGCCRSVDSGIAPGALLREGGPIVWQLPGMVSTTVVRGPPSDHVVAPAAPAR